MRMPADGRVTIPADIRERAGLSADSEIRVEFDGTAVRIVRVDPSELSRGARIVAHLRAHAGNSNLTTDELMEMTRGEE